MTNLQAIEKFISGTNTIDQKCNLKSEYGTLFHYKWYELAKWDNEIIVVRTGKNCSTTTTKVRTLLIRTLTNQSEVQWKLADNETNNQSDTMKL